MASFTRPKTFEETQLAIERSKAAKAKRMADTKRAIYDERFTSAFNEVKSKSEENKLPLQLSFISIDELSIDKTIGISNQIMVMYRNGEFEVLPKHTNGANVREYLGFKYSRIRFWCLLPTPDSGNHFVDFPHRERDMKQFTTTPKDIFLKQKS